MVREGLPQKQDEVGRGLVVIAANSFWNIKNFRSALIDALVGQGWRVLIAAPDPNPQWAEERGAETAEIGIDRSGMSPIRDFRLIANYHMLMASRRPKFFLGFTAKPNIYGSLAARSLGVTSLPNISGLGTAFIDPGPLSAVVGGLYRIALARCPVVFFQNSDDQDLFVRRKIIRPEQASLLPGSGVDLDRFRPAQGAGPGGVRFLFVGRIIGDKGVREFVEAARQLRSRYPDWRFQLLGPVDEGNRSGISQSELDGWVEAGSVEYLGEADDVRPHIAASTAVVLPSYREGLPRSLLEAAAMGRPLIATDVPGCRRIVDHGVNGLLCEVRSASSLADAMGQMGLVDQPKREAMGKSGRSMVERSFGEELVVRAYLDTLAQLHNRGRS